MYVQLKLGWTACAYNVVGEGSKYQKNRKAQFCGEIDPPTPLEEVYKHQWVSSDNSIDATTITRRIQHYRG